MAKRYAQRIDECVLDRYVRRQTISAAEYQVGLKFRQDYLRHVWQIKINDGGNPYRNEHSGNNAEARMLHGIASERRLKQAYAALSPPQRSIIIAVCGHDEWAGDSSRLETLQRGLQKLVQLWGCV